MRRSSRNLANQPRAYMEDEALESGAVDARAGQSCVSGPAVGDVPAPTHLHQGTGSTRSTERVDAVPQGEQPCVARDVVQIVTRDVIAKSRRALERRLQGVV